ncbi:hypothetical protein PF008_g24968 [Phytophthora fragariae]|uniref:Uncharacterized protein n=1 Tax=Phytophthora fragariae TaxID=53985 RepID=A0A6G0QLC9_9STRA|nr:hypothetical protein PF008_g24968 [Phytophthora fragariae]
MAGSDQGRELSPPGRDEVHAAWLAAGANGDTVVMKQLRSRFPEWLDLQWNTRPTASDSSSHGQARFCSWNNFHLHTIGASALHAAVWDGNLSIVQFVLEASQSPDTRDDNGVTPILLAIMRLNLITMRCVFRDGEAVRRNLVMNCRSELREQLQQVVAVITLLLQFSANANARRQDGKTALHCATSDDAYEVSKLLLDSGASVNAQDENGKTALHYCVHEGGLLVTNLLLAHGADINVEDSDGITPLKHVLQRADLNVLQLFVNHHQLVATRQGHDFSVSVLFQAVDLKVEAVVHFIVDNEYASVTARNAAGETPLHRAIVRHSPSVMEMLVDLDPEGDSLTAVTSKMETPAHYAARYGSAREVETLLLCLTRAFGDLEELVELGAANPLNTGDKSGMTSLYVAGTVSTESGEAGRSMEVRDAKVRLLLDHGGQLFPPEFLAQTLMSADTRLVVFPRLVKHCLEMWLLESDRGPEGVFPDAEECQSEVTTDFFVQWVASVDVDDGVSLTLLMVVDFVSFCVDWKDWLDAYMDLDIAFSSSCMMSYEQLGLRFLESLTRRKT